MTAKLDNESLLNFVLADFNSMVPTEEAAADIIYLILLGSRLACLCGCTDLIRKSGSRLFRCQRCKKTKHFTSGTLFAGVAKLRAWLGTVVLLGNGVAVSSNRLARLFDIAQATAHCMHKKILSVIAEFFDETANELLSKLFDEIIIRRSRESSVDRHPVHDGVESTADETSELSERACSDESSARSCAMEFLTVASPHLHAAVSTMTGYIGKYFHGVSRKCLQLYLASFWNYVDRKRWSTLSLLRACLDHAPVSYENILEARSTKIVQAFI